MVACRPRVGAKSSILYQNIGAKSKRVFQPSPVSFFVKTLRITFYVYFSFVIFF